MLKPSDAKKKVLEEIMDFADEALLSKVKPKAKEPEMAVEISSISAPEKSEESHDEEEMPEDDLRAMIQEYMSKKDDEEEYDPEEPVDQA